MVYNKQIISPFFEGKKVNKLSQSFLMAFSTNVFIIGASIDYFVK